MFEDSYNSLCRIYTCVCCQKKRPGCNHVFLPWPLIVLEEKLITCNNLLGEKIEEWKKIVSYIRDSNSDIIDIEQHMQKGEIYDLLRENSQLKERIKGLMKSVEDLQRVIYEKSEEEKP